MTRPTAPVGWDQMSEASGGKHAAKDGFGGALHGGHSGDAQALVEIGARGIVDAGHHVLNVENLTCDARGVMFELSPEETAAKAYASLMFA